MVNAIEWEPYNKFFDKQGKQVLAPLRDNHGPLAGFKNKNTGMIVLLNHYGEIAGRTSDKKEPK